jgi:hypothetical protein
MAVLSQSFVTPLYSSVGSSKKEANLGKCGSNVHDTIRQPPTLLVFVPYTALGSGTRGLRMRR